MLSTGSALNELAQNSSAQAGYLVEFTARVAGFGKQLGLTQAQIMGFGTAMDENLLKDEMAATAFGNMLTKMQTDTAKFAKIAGKDVKEFTDLLNKDANAAILALADSLKKADPQTMMKMLDDMGLDGSRAVAVLATMADKIDDVRRHQERATEAYEKATSVQGEFNTMNNTVQARIDKCKKQFHEMTVELGERLLPVVQYTITGGSMLAKTLSLLTSFVYNNWKALIILSAQVGVLTVMWKAHTVWLAIVDARNKAAAASTAALTAAQTLLSSAGVALHAMWAFLTKGIQGYIAVMRAARLASLTNPWAALATVLTVVGVAIYGVVKMWKSHSEAVRNNLQQVKEMRAQQELQGELTKKVNESIAEQKTKVEQLTRIIRSNAYSVGERRNAIKKLQEIIPDYHASISNEGKLYNDNSSAIKKYIQDLSAAALAEAVYQKKVEINRKKMDLDFKQHRIENSLKAVQAYRDTQQQVTEEMVYENGSVTKKQHKTKSAEESDRQQRIHEQRLAEVKSETKVVEAEEKYIDQVLEKNKKVNELFTKKTISPVTATTQEEQKTPAGDYVSDEEKKKQDADRKKRETEELKAVREQNKQLKAETDQRLAEEAVSYSLGLTDYLTYIEKRKEIQLEGIRQRKALFEEGSAEYLKLDAQEKQLLAHGDEEQRKLTLKEYEQMHRDLLLELEKDFNTEGSAIYQNEAAYREERFREEMDFLENKKSLTRKGSLERMQIEWEIEDRSKAHQLETQRYYEEQVEQLRENYLNMGNERLKDIALKGLEDLYRQGLIKEEEYQKAKIAIQAQYASAVSPDEQNAQTGSQMLTNARNKVNENAREEGKSYSMPVVGTIQQYQATMEQLKELYANDEENHAAYLAAKQQATAEFCQQMASQFQAAYNSVNQIMSAASSLYSAQADYETAVVKKKYEKQIAAAGNNQKKMKKLQEKQQKEEAAIKTKYNRKQVKIQIAQAIAQTAMNALNAYGSVVSIPVVGPALAVVAAAAAVAAGMIQIAAIKKQADAQEAGYYEGGYTGGKRYSKEAGVVHEGEFVANHLAVNNPNVRPMLDFIDKAQRNNTVGSLTAGDISRQLGQGGTAVVAPVVNVNNDNEDLRDSLDRSSEVSEELLTVIREKGIHLDFPMDSFDKAYKHFIKLNNR